MLPPVYALLSAAPDVVAIVGDRIHRNHAGDNPQAPYITWRVVSGVPQTYHGTPPSLDAFRVQIDCWGKPVDAKAAARAVRAALEPHGVEVSFFDDFDDETKLSRFNSDWRFQTPR
jgi:hypothetical protein